MNVLERIRHAVRDPNPIVRKELLVLLRTPTYVRFIVGGMLVLGLLVVSLALAASTGDDSPARLADTGRVLFQVFFAVTFLFIAVMGATFGAVSITQERENRTMDALTLSALGARRIVRGKLLAIFLAMAFVPVAMLPALGVVFLFGGVSVTHIALAALYSLAFGAVGVAVGVSVSARATSTRRALISTVPLVLACAMGLGATLTGLGDGLRRASGLTIEGPFFFTDAYLALPFDRAYVCGLIALPLYVVGASLWLAFASAHAGLLDASEDRALPVKRWTLAVLFVGVAVLRFAADAFTARPSARHAVVLFAQVLTTLLGVVLIGASAGDALERSARQRKRPPGIVTRMVFPAGVLPSMAFVVVACGLTLVALPAMLYSGVAIRADVVNGSLATGAWGAAYLLGLAGLASWVRVARTSPGAGRLTLVLVLLATFVLVFVVASLLGTMQGEWRSNPLLSVSPVWVVLVDADRDGAPWRSSGAEMQDLTLGAAFGYALLGAATLALAVRARGRVLARLAARNRELAGEAAAASHTPAP